PMAPLTWRSHHTIALTIAIAAARPSADYMEQVDAFWAAFYENAFADHFLQDSFSAGHSGFNRPSSPPSASYGYHGLWNERGKLFRDSANREWRSFGDDHLHDPANIEGRRRVFFAAFASTRDFLLAFITGKRWPSLERSVAMRIPVRSNNSCSDDQASG